VHIFQRNWLVNYAERCASKTIEKTILKRIIKRLLRITKTRNIAIRFVYWWWRRRSSTALSAQIETFRNSNKPIRIQIGSGGNRLAGWLNTDLTVTGEYFLNATDLGTVPDNCADTIFAEQIIEHLDHGQAVQFLDQAARKLKKNGTIRISTPDLHALASNYVNRTYLNSSLVSLVLGKGLDTHGDHESTSMNIWFYSWGHKFLLDETTLADMMTTSGLSNIKRFSVGKSDRPELTDVERHELGSANDDIALILQGELE
jgi:predicted SAM-dependent methyltransferase